MHPANEQAYDKNKGDAKLGFLWVALFGFAAIIAVVIVLGTVAGFNAVTAGPRDNLRSEFASACNKQFEAAQFPKVCVDFVMEP